MTSRELGNAMTSLDHHDINLDWERRKRLENLTTTALRFVVEVHAPTEPSELLDRRSEGRQMSYVDQHTAHQVPLAAHGLVDKRVGWTKSPPAHSSPSNSAPTESATARSDFANA